ncbi:DUF803-domain-containing protein [Athelia psychrophila]|uniref:DUF803-domain-containing protein n=1 Tax=Athelia psychrophila TaxID=1759441 RepID=A0A166N0J1_9AGAM|nr:DUF803-domain-containing protein [Fibularhizoctonia sp. CBS 109695]
MAPSTAVSWLNSQLLNEDTGIHFPDMTSGSVIGITVAICGNILISLALNFQKLAHNRLDREKSRQAREQELKTRKNSAVPSDNEDADSEDAEGTSRHPIPPQGPQFAGNSPLESSPLLRHFHSDPLSNNYGTDTPGDSRVGLISHSDANSPPLSPASTDNKKFMARLNPFVQRSKKQRTSNLMEVHEDTEPSDVTHVLVPVDEVVYSLAAAKHGKALKNDDDDLPPEHGNESDYLKSKLWWLGFLLMNIGECGNFISYAFAPASVVAPLGTFALIANCLFAPLLLHESFRKRDLLGILIATLGAVTVVLSSNSSDVRLDHDGLLRAISQRPFIVFTIVYISAAFILASLSETKFGRRYVFVDVGLCAIFGGFTVLSTKGISTLLTLQWIQIFTDWLTYPVILVLVMTGVGQIRYLNRALKRFDGKVVIPVQFVFFTLSAIIGSAILYGDFKTATFHQMVTFLYGCAATFLGVFIIAWAPPASSHDEYDDDFEAGPHGVESLGGIDGGDREQLERAVRNGNGGGIGVAAGHLGRRKVPVSPVGSAPVLRHRPSTVSLIGLSPAQHLLLVHTPPRERAELWDENANSSGGSPHRRRATTLPSRASLPAQPNLNGDVDQWTLTYDGLR